MQLSFLPPSCPATCTWSLRRVVSKWTGDGVAWSGEGGRDGVERKVLYVAVSASHVILSCDCGRILVVYSSIDHINAT